jgi:threonine synthase
MTELARAEGILACPEGAATVLAARELIRSSRISAADRVVLFNTASGLKYTELLN